MLAFPEEWGGSPAGYLIQAALVRSELVPEIKEEEEEDGPLDVRLALCIVTVLSPTKHS